MLLHTLLRRYDPQANVAALPDVEVGGVCDDSRLVRRGELFVARNGTKTDGQKFLADALARGAVAAVGSADIAHPPLPYFKLDDSSRAAPMLAHIFHEQPAAMLRMLGVTGTNGKTTTAYLLRHLLGRSGTRCGMIGTVEIDDGRTRREAAMTTPGSCELAGLLATMRGNGCTACAMEVSSHALDQQRVAGISFAGAAFTNLTGDHLDYHKTMDAYADAKARLFASLAPGATAAVNQQSPWADHMVRNCEARIVRFGFDSAANYWAEKLAVDAQGSRFLLHTPAGSAPVTMSLIGRHNVENALAAAALATETCGMSAEQIAQGLFDAAGAPGRLQSVRAGQPFAVLVDYAHTDDALENVLMALRPLTSGKLRVVFGCGGDRDPTKRPRMARIAEKLADDIYVTSDNPRTEDAAKILRDIQAGFSENAFGRVIVEIDRQRAIEKILSDASPGDVVLIAGKGHENYQIVGSTKYHFDDVEEATRVLGGRASAA